MMHNSKKLLKSGTPVKSRRRKRGERLEQAEFDFLAKCFGKKPASGGSAQTSKIERRKNADKTKNNTR